MRRPLLACLVHRGPLPHACACPRLADIVRVLKDINLNVVSAEVDTIGRNAVDRFNVTFHGEPLPGKTRWGRA